MNNFKQIFDALVSGIDLFQFVAIEDVVTLPDPTAFIVRELDIRLADGKAWQQGFAIDNTVTYNESTESTPHGLITTKTFSGIIPHDHAQIAENFYNNRHGKYLVKYVDRGGVRKLLGSLEEPLRLKFNFSQPGAPGAPKGWHFSFTGRHRNPSYYLELPELPQFWVEDGVLRYKGDLTDEFALVDGQLVVTGPQEDRYRLEDGIVYFD